ncbi:MAG: hypothetical protein SGI86_12190 [Deltaproteobacteria bacterium]|nr:hypothetical protein [Deltaproteobacteria bacterium]
MTGSVPRGISILQRLQRGIETLYRLDGYPDVVDFVVGESERDNILAASEERRPREQLFVTHCDGEIGLGLFLAPELLNNLAKHDPTTQLDKRNFADFCLAIEGVSHFVYVSHCAAEDRSVSALELELQAEVDKFVVCLLSCEDPERDARQVHTQIFDSVHFDEQLSPDEYERYRTANRTASRFTRTLERRFVSTSRRGDLMHELRQFYRMPLADKLAKAA